MILEFQKSKICPDDLNYFRLFLFQAVHCNNWNVQSLRSSEDPDFFLCGFFRSQFKNYQQVEYQKVWRKMILSEPLVNILRRDTKPCREEASADFWMSAPGWLSTQFNEACEGEMRQHKAGKFQTRSVFVFFSPKNEFAFYVVVLRGGWAYEEAPKWPWHPLLPALETLGSFSALCNRRIQRRGSLWAASLRIPESSNEPWGASAFLMPQLRGQALRLQHQGLLH